MRGGTPREWRKKRKTRKKERKKERKKKRYTANKYANIKPSLVLTRVVMADWMLVILPSADVTLAVTAAFCDATVEMALLSAGNVVCASVLMLVLSWENAVCAAVPPVASSTLRRDVTGVMAACRADAAVDPTCVMLVLI